MEDLRPLAGIRVFELSIAVAAPSAGRYLAFHGADVIKVESRTFPDVARLFGSAWARDADHAAIFMDTGPYLPEMSAGKRSLGLELKRPGALDAALAVIANCDVFLTNYSSPAVRDLGLGYDAVRAANPDIVYCAMPGFGSDPDLPYFEFLAYGPNQAPLVGLDAVTGYPDQDPAGIATFAPPDYVAGLHAVVAILTALEHRDATGEGTLLDVSQFETTVSLAGQYLIDNDRTGTVPERDGNRVPWAAPQGCYPCLGEDRFVAISVESDDQWRALCDAFGQRTWAADPRFADLALRRANHDALDALIAEWTAARSSHEVAATAQAAGVPAYAVLDHPEVLVDPQVRDRGWFLVRPCSRFGRDLFSGHPLRLDATPPDVARAGPNMGEDTVAVLGEVAGLDDAAVAALLDSGAAFADNEPDRVVARPFDRWYRPLGLVGREAR